jgi:hypothetical protein
MAVATLVSRITGFIRIVLLATILGAALSSAFSVAYQLPNLIAALVLEATFPRSSCRCWPAPNATTRTAAPHSSAAWSPSRPRCC